MFNNVKKCGIYIFIGMIGGMLLMFAFFSILMRKDALPMNKKSKIVSSEKRITFWTCSMHPQIKMPQKGLCPICGMELIPMEKGENKNDNQVVSLTLNPTARRLAEVETTEVLYKEAVHQVRLVGKVDYDETRLFYISAWIDGRIDRMYVDFTGTRVRKGDHLIKLYSPHLLAAQQEYLQAIKNLEKTRKSELGIMRETAEATLESAREKLRLYGISPQQIESIAQYGKPQEHMTIYSPISGTVIHKNGFKGMYVKTGDRIYTIADLSRVWLYLDAYESDIQWLHYGQKVEIVAESFPGEKFYGKIAFINPFVDEQTRTIKLRVNVENKDEKLKPGMFVRATIQSIIGQGGRIYEEDLAGKWICPMHPDVVKDHQAPCDTCGMNLVETKEFGFAQSPSLKKKVLVIPKTSVLLTGKRAIVYVENVDDTTGVYRYTGREILLGPRAGNNYIVMSGLKEGERVVTKGNFKIDSALQIQAKPSMMNPADYYREDSGIISGKVSAEEDAGLLALALSSYLKASQALSDDDFEQAALYLKTFYRQIKDIIQDHQWQDKTKGLAGKLNRLQDVLTQIETEKKLLRRQFGRISLILKDIFAKYPYNETMPFYLGFCPMALGKGAYWFQDSDTVRNPYYGEAMLECGEIQKKYGEGQK